MAVTAHDIEARLREQLQPQSLTVQDDSAAHAGHAGAREGRHFSVQIRASAFAGLSRLARHRLVYDSLGPLMSQGVHALVVDADVPSAP